MGLMIDLRNKKWSKKLGWTPHDFGAKDFDKELENRILWFQAKHKIDMDGICGPQTYRRLVTALQTNPVKNLHDQHIMIQGHPHFIGWPTVWKPLPSYCFKKVKSPIFLPGSVRTPKCIVTHHDVCTSANSCFNTLQKGKISTHFDIDNDGVIYQFVDVNDIAWHEGTRDVNNVSIGIDFCNAWYLSYNKWYKEHGFGEREVLYERRLHGSELDPHLDMYPVQIEAYKVLLKFFNKLYSIPLECPVNDSGDLIRGVHKPCQKGNFEGVQSHYHSQRGKIDTDIDMVKILKECKEEE